MNQIITSVLQVIPRYRQELLSPVSIVIMGALLLAVVLGYLSVFAGLFGGYRPAFLVVLPAIIALGFFFLIDRQALLVVILFFRAGLDPILETTKIPLGGSSMGLGGVLNGLIILLVLFAVKAEHIKLLKKPALIALPFFLVLLVGVFRSAAPADAIKAYLALITYASMFAIGVVYSEKWGSDRVLKLVLYAGAIPIVTGLAMMMLGARAPDGRFTGPFEHANIMAFFMLNVAIVGLYFRSKSITGKASNHGTKPAVGQWLVAVAIMGALVMLVMSQTRSAWAALATVLIVYVLLFERRMLLPLIGGAALMFFVPAVQDRLMDLKDDRGYLIYSQLNSFDWRVVLWSDALGVMSAKDYVVGSGFGSFIPDSARFFSLGGGHGVPAHSVYVQLLYETGVPGAFAFILMLISLLISVVFSAGSKSARFSGLCIILVLAFICYSDNVINYLVFNIYAWLILGALYFEGRRMRLMKSAV